MVIDIQPDLVVQLAQIAAATVVAVAKVAATVVVVLGGRLLDRLLSKRR